MDVLASCAGSTIDEIAWYVQGPPPKKVSIPMIISDPGPPSTPVLDDIDNPGGISVYTVSWSAVEMVKRYVLEEDTTPDFSSPEVVYSGVLTYKEFSAKEKGTYHYRVRAENELHASAWSETKSTVVSKEQVCEQHDFSSTASVGPSGYSKDFTAVNNMEGYKINIKANLTLQYGSSETVYVYVKVNDVNVGIMSIYVTNSSTFYRADDTSFNLQQGDKITYYIKESSSNNIVNIRLNGSQYVRLCGHQ
jgi:hypothetical protein